MKIASLGFTSNQLMRKENMKIKKRYRYNKCCISFAMKLCSEYKVFQSSKNCSNLFQQRSMVFLMFLTHEVFRQAGSPCKTDTAFIASVPFLFSCFPFAWSCTSSLAKGYDPLYSSPRSLTILVQFVW